MEGANGPCTLSLRRLAEMCEVEEEEILNSGVAYWVSKGVLKEVTAAEAGPAAAAGRAGDPAYLGYDEGPDRFFQVVEVQEMLAAMDMSVSGDDAMGNQVDVFMECVSGKFCDCMYMRCVLRRDQNWLRRQEPSRKLRSRRLRAMCEVSVNMHFSPTCCQIRANFSLYSSRQVCWRGRAR